MIDAFAAGKSASATCKATRTMWRGFGPGLDRQHEKGAGEFVGTDETNSRVQKAYHSSTRTGAEPVDCAKYFTWTYIHVVQI